MMPLQLFSNRIFSGVNLLTFFLYAGLGAGLLFLSLDLVQAQGYSQLQSGLTFLPFTILMISLARFAGSYADKVGPRLLLTVGPATVGVGLLMLSFIGQTKGPGSYWTSFFPAIFLLGLGMSVTVAPLTTAVMRSVSDQLSGVASGVNNAMTRISNVFANAIFGALAVLLFSGTLTEKLNESSHGAEPKTLSAGTKASHAEASSLDAETKKAAIAQAANLGNAKIPDGVNDRDKALITRAYRESFIDTYAVVMRLSAALAFTGALMALLFVKSSPRSAAGDL